MRVPHYFFSSGEKSSNTKNYKKCRRSPSLTFPFPARNIVGPLWLKTVTCGLFLRHFVPPRRASAIPTVTSFPRNDKLCRRMRRLITFIRFKPKRTPVPPCHCEERNARRGNLPEGKTDEPYTTIPNTCPQRLTAEKSSAIEPERNVFAPARLPAGAPCSRTRGRENIYRNAGLSPCFRRKIVI